MSNENRKQRVEPSPKQKHEYARLMVEENYTNKQIIELSGACSSAVTRWKRQYLAESRGEFLSNQVPLDADKRRILGPNLGMPHTRAMSDDLFELHLKGQEGIAPSFLLHTCR